MPTYEFVHNKDGYGCGHEWEEFMSIKAEDPPCPKCNTKENVVRLISGGSGKGKVELYGQDLADKIKEDTQKLKKDIHSSEKLYSNILGPDKYEKIQRQIDSNKRNKY